MKVQVLASIMNEPKNSIEQIIKKMDIMAMQVQIIIKLK